MKKKDWYENWFSSAYYPILYGNRDENEAERFVNALIEHLKPPKGSKMLDIACGEGRFAFQLEEHGHDVTGIDLSYKSILTAKEQENEHLHFYVHDMRYPFYINYFDYAFNFFTSFGYFGTERDHLMAAKSFARGLKKGGTLVVDYLNATYTINNLVAEETIEKQDYTFRITKNVVEDHIIKDIRFNSLQGEPLHYAERVAAFTLNNFEEIFSKAGLTLTETFGNYRLEPFDELTSPRLIMIFKK